jgi:hypothetical protein
VPFTVKPGSLWQKSEQPREEVRIHAIAGVEQTIELLPQALLLQKAAKTSWVVCDGSDAAHRLGRSAFIDDSTKLACLLFEHAAPCLDSLYEYAKEFMGSASSRLHSEYMRGIVDNENFS